MKILIKMGHPADVHFYKHFIWAMEKRGHEVLVCATDKDVTLKLLDAYCFKYKYINKTQKNLLGKLFGLVQEDFKVWFAARQFKPDIFTGMGSISPAHVSAIMRRHYVAFEDTEHSKEQYFLYAPFASTICTPASFGRDLGKKQVRYNGYHQIAYLHPNYYKPDPAALEALKLNAHDKFIIVRFVAWQATHDVGQHGFSSILKRKLIEELERHAKVFITSENPLPDDLKKYELPVSPDKIMDLLYYATMYVGEGSTMAIEAALLGTPSIYVSTLSKSLGHCAELDEKYHLMYRFFEPVEAINKAVELLAEPDLKSKWHEKAQQVFKDKIDVTKFVVDFIESYPIK